MRLSLNDLFKESQRTRYLLQVVMTPEDKARGEALAHKLKHKTLGKIWRYCIRTGLDHLESHLERRGKKS